MKVHAKTVSTSAVILVLVWLGLSFVGYGMAMRKFDATKLSLPGEVVAGFVDWRQSLGFGYFGETCFRVSGQKTTWCIPEEYIDPDKLTPREVYKLLKPGTKISILKGVAGRPADLSVETSPGVIVQVIDYGRANGLGLRDRVQKGGGFGFMVAGFSLWALAVTLGIGHQRERVKRGLIALLQRLRHAISRIPGILKN